MFETAVVRARAADRRFGFLTLSLAAHTAVIAAVIAASLASTPLPQESPRQMMRVYFAPPVTLPPALGTPSPPRAAAPHAAMPHVPAVQTAPAAIPDAIPNVAPAAESPAGESQQQQGVPWGTPGGVRTEAPPAPDAVGPLVAGVAGVKAPVVIRRVEPVYPPLPLHAHMSGWVVVQCIIDKTGHIRDVRVVNSSFAAFEQSAIDAVQQWLFSPGTLNGQPVDTIFELTVKFQVR